MRLGNWRELADRGPDLLLCLDFPGGRATAGFAELAEVAPVDACFLHIGQSAYVDGSDPLDVRARRWVLEVLDTRRPIRAVLGHCAGAGLATCVADVLADAGAPRPAVLLLDAVAVTDESLCGEFTAAVESSAEHLTTGELQDARTWGAELLATCSGDLPRVAAGLVERYDELVTAVAGRLSLADVFRRELSAGFAAYLAYLLLAAQGSLEMRTGTPGFVTSRDDEVPVPAARHIPLDVGHADLLRDAEVSKLLAGLLRGEHPW